MVSPRGISQFTSTQTKPLCLPIAYNGTILPMISSSDEPEIFGLREIDVGTRKRPYRDTKQGMLMISKYINNSYLKSTKKYAKFVLDT